MARYARGERSRAHDCVVCIECATSLCQCAVFVAVMAIVAAHARACTSLQLSKRAHREASVALCLPRYSIEYQPNSAGFVLHFCSCRCKCFAAHHNSCSAAPHTSRSQSCHPGRSTPNLSRGASTRGRRLAVAGSTRPPTLRLHLHMRECKHRYSDVTRAKDRLVCHQTNRCCADLATI